MVSIIIWFKLLLTGNYANTRCGPGSLYHWREISFEVSAWNGLLSICISQSHFLTVCDWCTIKFFLFFHLQRLSSIETPEEELCDYEPCEYAYEEESESLPDLDPIPIAEPTFDPDELLDVGPSFSTLASICEPLPQNWSIWGLLFQLIGHYHTVYRRLI